MRKENQAGTLLFFWLVNAKISIIIGVLAKCYFYRSGHCELQWISVYHILDIDREWQASRLAQSNHRINCCTHILLAQTIHLTINRKGKDEISKWFVQGYHY